MRQIWQIVKDRLQGKAPPGSRRSSAWRSVRADHLEEFPECAVCGSARNLEVHHILPFAMFPDLELEPGNLLTLCEHGRLKSLNCHLLIGHLGDYRKFNPSAGADAVYWRRKLND